MHNMVLSFSPSTYNQIIHKTSVPSSLPASGRGEGTEKKAGNTICRYKRRCFNLKKNTKEMEKAADFGPNLIKTPFKFSTLQTKQYSAFL